MHARREIVDHMSKHREAEAKQLLKDAVESISKSHAVHKDSLSLGVLQDMQVYACMHTRMYVYIVYMHVFYTYSVSILMGV